MHDNRKTLNTEPDCCVGDIVVGDNHCLCVRLTHIIRPSSRWRGNVSPKKKRLVRAPKTRKPRQKQSLQNASDDWDNLSYDRQESVSSRVERERRRQVVQEAERAWLGTPKEDYQSGAEVAGLSGVVTSVMGTVYLVDVSGKLVECRIRESIKAQETGFVNAIAVGDNVVLTEDGAGGFAIKELLERDSFLTRPASFKGHLRQIVAANVDQLTIVSSWQEPIIWTELIDRYLVAADIHDLDPIICITKIDLVSDPDELVETLAPYRSLDYPMVLTSTVTGDGIDELREHLSGKSTVLSGLSGAGKSSLLNAIQPGLGLRVGEISTWRGRDEGRHTTTQATLLRIDDDTSVVDTPGIREWGLSGLTRTELWHYFPEIEQASADCKFTDCHHFAEPDCAVIAATEAGQIDGERYYSYTVIYESLPESIATW